MRCEEKVDDYCKEKIAYNRISESELCEKCCLGCKEYRDCKAMCKVLEIKFGISLEG